ncbi:RNA chaperone Hfq [Bacillus mycoides]|uniref:RNA chaperone Hfq n=1 Tax=Bacillus mycoides TaxID=1405 RepID=UPI003D24DCCC
MERKPQALQKERTRNTVSLQEQLLQEAVQRKKSMTIILVNGVHIKGTIQGYDLYSILVDAEGKQQLVYKHAISTIWLENKQ